MSGKGGEEGVTMHVIFSGIVQGVFFRANTRRQALKLGLRGWVRNLPNGTVEAWVVGPSWKVDELIEFCKAGIPGAHVDRVEAEEMVSSEDYRTFEVLR